MGSFASRTGARAALERQLSLSLALRGRAQSAHASVALQMLGRLAQAQGHFDEVRSHRGEAKGGVGGEDGEAGHDGERETGVSRGGSR